MLLFLKPILVITNIPLLLQLVVLGHYILMVDIFKLAHTSSTKVTHQHIQRVCSS